MASRIAGNKAGNGTPSAPAAGKGARDKVASVQFPLFLLWLLSKREMHGYDVIKTIRSDPLMGKIAASRIYPVLARLTNKRMVAQKTLLQGRRARKLYRLTPRGREALRTAKWKLKSSRLIVGFMEEMLR